KKSLAKLARWETKIKALLYKTSPETFAKLFGNNQLTFSTLLQKIEQGENIAQNYPQQYNNYRDKLATSLSYIEQQQKQAGDKFLKPVKVVQQKMKGLDDEITKAEALEKFIKERKQLLIEESIKQIGKSKYLTKINKEAYYYAETLRNYKELFSDPKKAEETVLEIIEKIPAFKEFFRKNSMLSSLFKMPGSAASSIQSIAGLQTRVQVNDLIQQQIAAGGPNAMAQVKQNLQQAQAALNKVKDKIIKSGGSSSDADIPDFKPNTQKSKIFAQRLEYTTDFQFGSSNISPSTTADIGLNIGYKLNDKSIIGVGLTYKIGMGSIEKIKFSNEGIGLRSFVEWKLVKGKGKLFSNMYLSGGYERNYFPYLKQMPQVAAANISAWSESGLIGISKKIGFKSKFIKGTKLQLLYDFLYQQQLKGRRPILFRIGYNF
ncbi:MAG TPA: hypothetical protein PK872_08320, partial [Ferruginibacter sp.]|nr:hypothetical protein [Ferruginibacter sp.]